MKRRNSVERHSVPFISARSAERHLVHWFLLFAFVGCSESGTGIIVTGNVTLDGKPVEKATIVFLPKEHGQASPGAVKNGHYRIAADQGVQEGKYEVKVTIGEMRKQGGIRPTGSLEKFQFDREVKRDNPRIDFELSSPKLKTDRKGK